MPNRRFGDIDGVPVGSTYKSREDLAHAGVHKPTQAGISGSEKEGADSIVLSGGYEDDEDLGEIIVYTGHGGQDPLSRRQIADQELTRRNLALAVTMQQGLPVRVIRGSNHNSQFAPPTGYRYDGLYNIENYWHEKGKSGFRIWRFRLARQIAAMVDTLPLTSSTLAPGNANPGRTTLSVSRVIRDTALSRKVKQMYDFKCQVCCTRLEGPASPYAEAAHVRPLGRPHNGPDTADNLICLCPNHHYLFDVGAFGIRADLRLIGLPGLLRVHGEHRLSADHLEYHRVHFGLIDQIEAPNENGDRVPHETQLRRKLSTIPWKAHDVGSVQRTRKGGKGA